MELLQLRAVDRPQRRLGLARSRVGMLAEERAAEFAVREELRRCLLLRHVLQPLLLQDRDLVGGHRRVHRDVGHEIDQLRRELREAARRQRRVVLRDGSGQRSAHAEELTPDLAARPRLRAFLHDVGGERRQPGEDRGIAGISGPNGERHRHFRYDFLSRDDDAQAVGQCFLDARRELERTLRPGGWTFGLSRGARCDRESGEANGKRFHFVPPSGRRSIDVRLAGTRYFFAAV